MKMSFFTLSSLFHFFLSISIFYFPRFRFDLEEAQAPVPPVAIPLLPLNGQVSLGWWSLWTILSSTQIQRKIGFEFFLPLIPFLRYLSYSFFSGFNSEEISDKTRAIISEFQKHYTCSIDAKIGCIPRNGRCNKIIRMIGK